MKTIQSFALKHTLIYCILAEILVLGGMMAAGTAVSVVVYVVLGWDVDYYVLIEEIMNLKNITGYKKENEFNLPKLNIKSLKNEIK